MTTKGPIDLTTKPGYKHIQFDFANVCKTTGWYNNCGLNCLTHFMFDKLSAISEKDFDVFLVENPEYIALADTFKRYYDLKENISWQEILRILREHTVPTDKEAIFAPVLRLHLGKVLGENAEILLNTDASTVSDYITGGVLADVAQPVYAANKAFYDSLRQDFQVTFEASLKANSHATDEELIAAEFALKDNNDHKKIKDYQPSGMDILKYVIFKRKSDLESQYYDVAQDHWFQEGCKKYADYMANMNNQVMVSADQLQFLAGHFNINVDVFTPGSLAAALDNELTAQFTHGAQSISELPRQWTLKVINNGNHWTFQQPDSKLELTTQHNRHYESGRTNEMLGKYKIHTGQAATKDRMIAEVRCLLGEISSVELEELKQVELLAAQFAHTTIKSTATAMTALKPHVHAILDASKEGKEYIQLILANEKLLKLINEQFDVSITCTFIQSYAAIVEKIKTRNPVTQLAFFEGFLKNVRVQPVKEVQAAMSIPVTTSAPLMMATQREGIILSHYALLQQDEFAKQMIDPIEKNPDVLKVFNGFSTEGVRKFVQYCHTNKLPALLKVKPESLLSFLQQFEGKFLPKEEVKVKFTM